MSEGDSSKQSRREASAVVARELAELRKGLRPGEDPLFWDWRAGASAHAPEPQPGAPPVEAEVPPVAPARRYPWWAYGGLGLALAIVLGAVALRLSRGHESPGESGRDSDRTAAQAPSGPQRGEPHRAEGEERAEPQRTDGPELPPTPHAEASPNAGDPTTTRERRPHSTQESRFVSARDQHAPPSPASSDRKAAATRAPNPQHSLETTDPLGPAHF